MKLYTRTGDDGTTGLVGGIRVKKDALRIEAYGNVDELNCALGLALASCQHMTLARTLRQLQEQLFQLGADLSTPMDADAQISRINAPDVEAIELQIDDHCQSLPPLKHFILPGGTELSSRLHLARAVCRRAERYCVALSRQEQINPHAAVYLNRLGDLLFALSRCANHLERLSEPEWLGRDA